MPKIYFLCTGNSSRSQIAEGLAKHILSSTWEIQSAGVEKHGLNPLAVEVLQEDGIDISEQYSKLIDPEYLQQSAIIVTLCGDARDKCPVTPPSIQKIHWPLPDPAQVTGTHEQRLDAFRQTREELRTRLTKLAAQLNV